MEGLRCANSKPLPHVTISVNAPSMFTLSPATRPKQPSNPNRHDTHNPPRLRRHTTRIQTTSSQSSFRLQWGSYRAALHIWVFEGQPCDSKHPRTPGVVVRPTLFSHLCCLHSAASLLPHKPNSRGRLQSGKKRPPEGPSGARPIVPDALCGCNFFLRLGIHPHSTTVRNR